MKRIHWIALLLCCLTRPALAQFTVEVEPVVVEAKELDLDRHQRYQWKYETRVHNGFDFPLRVVAFTTQAFRDGAWRENPQPHDAEKFTDWYTDGDPVEDGWIAPGQTAIDAANWNMGQPLIPRTGWIYRAVDESGREYAATVELEVRPFVPDRPNWRGVTATDRIPVIFRVERPDGAEPAELHLFVNRQDQSFGPYASYRSANGMVEATVPREGVYFVDVYSPELERARVSLFAEQGVDRLAVDLVIPERDGDPAAFDARFEGDGGSGDEAWALYESWISTREERGKALVAYKDAHLDYEGFEFDAGEVHASLRQAMSQTERVRLREFAAFLVTANPLGDAPELLQLRSEILAADSPVWSCLPWLALNGAMGSDNPEEFLHAVAEKHSDPAVRFEVWRTLARGAKSRGDSAELSDILDRMETEFASIPGATGFVEEMKVVDLMAKGRTLAEFDVPTLGGQRLSRDDLEGGYTFLHFWATWCGPCLREMESIHEIHDAFAPRGLRFVSVSLDTDRKQLGRYRAEKWKLPWTNLLAEDVENYDQVFGVRAVPSLFLVGPDGTILENSNTLRGEQLASTLEKYLAPAEGGE